MKRGILFFSLVLISRMVWADITADGSNIFTTDSRTVLVSTNCATPTQICTVDNFITRTWIVNPSTWTNVYLSTTSVSVSSNSFFVPTSTVFTPDGPQVPFWGQLFACSSATLTGVGVPVSMPVSVLREK
jgi:hypothetical protein